MLETSEQIQGVLEVCGEPITFTIGTPPNTTTLVLKAIPSELVSNIQSFDSPADIYKQVIEFQIAQEDLDANAANITIGKSFTYTLLSKMYSFTITDIWTDFIGWITLSVKFASVT